MISRLVVMILLSALLTACVSRNTAAPVISLSTKPASKQNLTQITGNTYVVERGDTLFSIAFYSGNTYENLAKWNNIKAPFVIKPGQKLRLSRVKNVNNLLSQTSSHQPSSQKIKQEPVDEYPHQAYGEDAADRKNHTNKSKVSKKSYESRRWIWPASGSNRIATVGIDGSIRGIDIKGTDGSPILAAANGKIVYAGNALKGYGNLIIIKHDDEYLSAYAHNSDILVNEQSYVKQGQQIATMGDTGASETMLHFEIRKRGKSMDPLAYLP